MAVHWVGKDRQGRTDPVPTSVISGRSVCTLLYALEEVRIAKLILDKIHAYAQLREMDCWLLQIGKVASELLPAVLIRILQNGKGADLVVLAKRNICFLF